MDTASVYWANRDGGTIARVPLAGGPPTTIATSQSSVHAIAVDATSVYWTTAGTPDNNCQDGTVMKLTPKQLLSNFPL